MLINQLRNKNEVTSILIPGLFTLKPGNTGWSSATFTAGAMVSTADDMLTWLEALFSNNEILSPSIMEHFGVKKNDLIFDDVIVAEYLTFMEIMNKADIHIFLQ